MQMQFTGQLAHLWRGTGRPAVRQLRTVPAVDNLRPRPLTVRVRASSSPDEKPRELGLVSTTTSCCDETGVTWLAGGVRAFGTCKPSLPPLVTSLPPSFPASFQAPAKPKTAYGEMLQYYLTMEPQLFRAAVEDQLEKLQAEKEEKEKEPITQQTEEAKKNELMVLYK